MCREGPHSLDEAVMNGFCSVVFREVHEHHVVGGALDQGGDRGLVVGAGDEVAFPAILLRAFDHPRAGGMADRPARLRRLTGNRCPPMIRPLIENYDIDRWVRTCRRGYRQCQPQLELIEGD